MAGQARSKAAGGGGVETRPGGTQLSRRRAAARLGGGTAAGLLLAACGPLPPAPKTEAKPANLEVIAYTWGEHVRAAWNTSLTQYMARHANTKVEFTDGGGYG